MKQENKINIAELLKGCPKGMELDSTLFDDIYFDCIDDVCDIIKCYIQESKHKIDISFDKYGHYSHISKSKCVIFPKGKTTWEGFVPPCQFKDGDIVYVKTKGHNQNEFIIIFQGIRNDHIQKYVCFAYQMLSTCKAAVCHLVDVEFMRLATEEEKQKLFDAIKANGYKWNEKTKTLEELIIPKFKVGDVIQDIDTYKVKVTEVNIEDECYGYESMIVKRIGSISFSEQDDWELVPKKFDITTLKPFDKVLVRDSYKHIWCASIFSNTWKNKYYCVGMWYNQCIPYEGNEHLLGTTDDCDEFYKTW